MADDDDIGTWMWVGPGTSQKKQFNELFVNPKKGSMDQWLLKPLLSDGVTNPQIVFTTMHSWDIVEYRRISRHSETCRNVVYPRKLPKIKVLDGEKIINKFI